MLHLGRMGHVHGSLGHFALLESIGFNTDARHVRQGTIMACCWGLKHPYGRSLNPRFVRNEWGCVPPCGGQCWRWQGLLSISIWCSFGWGVCFASRVWAFELSYIDSMFLLAPKDATFYLDWLHLVGVAIYECPFEKIAFNIAVKRDLKKTCVVFPAVLFNGNHSGYINWAFWSVTNGPKPPSRESTKRAHLFSAQQGYGTCNNRGLSKCNARCCNWWKRVNSLMSSGRPRDQDVWVFDDRVRRGDLQVSYEKARGN